MTPSTFSTQGTLSNLLIFSHYAVVHFCWSMFSFRQSPFWSTMASSFLALPLFLFQVSLSFSGEPTVCVFAVDPRVLFYLGVFAAVLPPPPGCFWRRMFEHILSRCLARRVCRRRASLGTNNRSRAGSYDRPGRWSPETGLHPSGTWTLLPGSCPVWKKKKKTQILSLFIRVLTHRVETNGSFQNHPNSFRDSHYMVLLQTFLRCLSIITTLHRFDKCTRGIQHTGMYSPGCWVMTLLYNHELWPFYHKL